MNEGRLNQFDAGNAAELCEASAAAYTETGTYEAVYARSTDTYIRMARDEADLIVAFRGTADIRNWLTDLDCARDAEGRCRVHRGFARAVDSVQAEVNAAVLAASGEGLRIWLTGHSLGGALAMLFAWRFYNAHGDAPFAGTYTFGQPRVGDGSFRDSYGGVPELFGRTFRVVHADDVVPRVPWLLGFYRHSGHEVFFTGAGRRKAGFGNSEAWRLDCGLIRKLPWDTRNAWREMRQGKLALLADHHVATYQDLFRGIEGGLPDAEVEGEAARGANLKFT